MSDTPVLPRAQVVTSYYLRLRVADQAGVLAKVTGILADAAISIDAVLQREADDVVGDAPVKTNAHVPQTDLIILTHDCAEASMNAALATMQALPTVLEPITRIRKEELA
jgi:homoserine dehydrogenase